MSNVVSAIYIKDTKSQALFDSKGLKPHFLLENPGFKTLVVGLEAGQQIPLHPEEASMYYFLEGEGLMMVGDDVFAIQPGVTIIVLAGIARGISAKTRVIFLGAKGG